MLCILYSAVVVPLRICFRAEAEGGERVACGRFSPRPGDEASPKPWGAADSLDDMSSLGACVLEPLDTRAALVEALVDKFQRHRWLLDQSRR